MALIELKSLVKTFKMGDENIRAINELSFSIKEGELVSIIGPSGCGKSTLMNILGMLDQPESGEYLLGGHSTKALNDDERAKLRNQRIGFVFQSFNLLPRMTALRNVEMPLVYSSSYTAGLTQQQIQERATQALQRVGLGDRLSHHPNELSGGQRQRVAIARALVNNPSILLADEPTGNLDSKSGRDILDLFKELNRQGVTIIIVTHDKSVAQEAGHVIALKDGKILEETYADR